MNRPIFRLLKSLCYLLIVFATMAALIFVNEDEVNIWGSLAVTLTLFVEFAIMGFIRFPDDEN